MSAQEYIVCLHLWLGICLFPLSPSSSRCYCGSILDSHRDHVLGCHSGSLRNKRHNALCDIIFHCLRTNNSGTRREQHCTSENQSRLGDVFHPDFCKVVPHILISLSEILFNHLILYFPLTQLVLLQQQGRWKKSSPSFER